MFVDGNMNGTDVSISSVPNVTTISIEGNGYQNASEVDSSFDILFSIPFSPTRGDGVERIKETGLDKL